MVARTWTLLIQSMQHLTTGVSQGPTVCCIQENLRIQFNPEKADKVAIVTLAPGVTICLTACRDRASCLLPPSGILSSVRQGPCEKEGQVLGVPGHWV